MALLNEILVGRYNRLAQKLLSMKGPAALPQLAGELRFVLPLFHGIENRNLEGWDLFSNGPTPYAAPGAGNLLLSQLRNPVGSNVVAVLTRVMWEEAAATNTTLLLGSSLQLNRGPVTSDQNTIDANTQAWDTRSRPASTSILSHNSAAGTIPGGGFGLAFGAVAAFVAVDLLRTQDEVPLLPGMAALMISGNTNTGATAQWWWRERFLEDSERK